MEMYAGCVACCPLVSHVEYVPSAEGTDGLMDGRTSDHCIALTASIIITTSYLVCYILVQLFVKR